MKQPIIAAVYADRATADAAVKVLDRARVPANVAEHGDEFAIMLAELDLPDALHALEPFDREQGLIEDDGPAPDQPNFDEMPPQDLVTVATFARVFDAQMAQQDLGNIGIPSFLADTNMSHLYGGLIPAIQVRLQVPTRFVDAARKALGQE